MGFPSATLKAPGSRHKAAPAAPTESVIVHDGKQYIPLKEAQHFYESGVRSGAAERIEWLEAQLSRMEAERDELAAAMQDEYTVHEQEMKKLLTVALALETEASLGWLLIHSVLSAPTVEKRTEALQEALGAEHDLEEQFAAQLKALHQQDVEDVEESMHERFQAMGHALRTALAGKDQWRHRAVEAERQLGELLAHIQERAEGAGAGGRKAVVKGGVDTRAHEWKQADED
ncbi:hypothetical protein N2152v2_006774 [Parachlorella kessleri]